MNAAIEVLPTLNGIPYFGAAKIVADCQQRNWYKVKALLMGSERVVKVRMAVQHSGPVLEDDEVLIAGSDINNLFIIGVLTNREGDNAENKVIQTKKGAYATLASNQFQQNEKIQVFSSRHELLFEYDPASEKATVNVAKGDLKLRAEQGDIELEAAQDVRIKGHAIGMSSQRLNIKSGYAKLVFDRLDSMADTLVEQAKNVYRTVLQLTQLRTGRMRTLVDETYQLKTNKAFLKSEDDFKIKGEKIHLG